MKKIISIILIFVVFNSANIFSQDEVDTVTNKSTDSTAYRFGLSLKPQDGYSFILIFSGSPKNDVNFDDFEIGFARSIISNGHEGGIINRTVTLGLIKYNGNNFYSFGFGYNLRSFLDIGLFMNFKDNFSGSNAFTLRPHIGFVFLPPLGSIYIEAGYNINFLKNNFEIPSLGVFGFRYNIGFLKKG